MNFFDFVNSVSNIKNDLLSEDPENLKLYNSWMINKQLSQFPDTVMYASEMNRYYSIPSKWQYYFYLHGIQKRKRFAKWTKKSANSEDIKLIMKEFNYSTKKAESVISTLR